MSYKYLLLLAFVLANVSAQNKGNFRFTPGSDFFDKWDYWGTNDTTTWGKAYYTSKQECLDEGLCTIDGKVARMSVNAHDVQEYRRSHRLTSKIGFRLGTHFIDVKHMPTGCATWPSIWTTGENWPNNGEIDIFEGVNTQGMNLNHIHTADGCKVSQNTNAADGKLLHTNCFALSEGNTGCGFEWNNKNSFGAGFNKAGGGVVIMNWTDKGMTFQFIPRSEVHKYDILVNPPADLPANFDVSKFGPFVAQFDFSEAGECKNGNKYFGAQKYIINNSFCGDWAGGIWPSCQDCVSQFGASCDHHVKNDPQAFKESYWEINEIRVYNAEIYHPKKDNSLRRIAMLLKAENK